MGKFLGDKIIIDDVGRFMPAVYAKKLKWTELRGNRSLMFTCNRQRIDILLRNLKVSVFLHVIAKRSEYLLAAAGMINVKLLVIKYVDRQISVILYNVRQSNNKLAVVHANLAGAAFHAEFVHFVGEVTDNSQNIRANPSLDVRITGS